MQRPKEELVVDEMAPDETSAGSNPAPDQDLVDEIGRTIGLTYEDDEPLRAGAKEHERDAHRWELDPASSEDYAERVHAAAEEAEPLRHMKHEHRSRRTMSGR